MGNEKPKEPSLLRLLFEFLVLLAVAAGMVYGVVEIAAYFEKTSN